MESVVRARIDANVKERAEQALQKMGKSASDVIRLLMLYVADQGRLPFELLVAAAPAPTSESEYKKGLKSKRCCCCGRWFKMLSLREW
jgi:DNA-damage-inducible protein J